VKKASEVIAEKFLKHLSDFDSYLLYMDFRNEIMTGGIIEGLYEAGKRVYLPKVQGSNMVVGQYMGKESLVRGAFDICEPAGVVDEKDFGCVVTPGVVFDKHGSRVGFGKGYYDRFLSGVSCDLIVGLAYDFQVVKHVEAEEHDKCVDIILTEKDLYRRKML